MDPENEKRLITILERTLAFVRFAEAKNAALIALSAGLIAGILKSGPTLGHFSGVLISIAVPLLAIAALVALHSFLPITTATKRIVLQYPDEQTNPLYFGHAARLTGEEFLEELYCDGKVNRHYLELMYAQQIVVNSQIAFLKLTKFKYAALLSIAAVAFLGFGVISQIIES